MKAFPEINHQFDIWHFFENVSKRLNGKVKLKIYQSLQPWVQSVSNHLRWASGTCCGDAHVLKEKWCGILPHITNKHSWPTDEKEHKYELSQ